MQISDEKGFLYLTSAQQLPVAQEYIIFSSKFYPFVSSRFWTQQITGTTATIAPYNSGISLNSGSGIGRAKLIGKNFAQYLSGLGMIVRFSIILGDTGEEGNVREWGYGDEQNGLFFRLNGTRLEFVRRRNGAEVEVIDSEYWDTPVTPDPYGHLYMMQFQWFGVGNIYLYYDMDLVHTVKFTGTDTDFSFQIPDQTIFIKNENLAQTQSNHTLILGGVELANEGNALNSPPINRTILNENPIFIDACSYQPIIALRFPHRKNGFENHRYLNINRITISSSVNTWIKIVKNSLLTGTFEDLETLPDPSIAPEIEITDELATGSAFVSGVNVRYCYTYTQSIGETRPSPVSTNLTITSPPKKIKIAIPGNNYAKSIRLYRSLNGSPYYLVGELSTFENEFLDNGEPAGITTPPSFNNTAGCSLAEFSKSFSVSGGREIIILNAGSFSPVIHNFEKRNLLLIPGDSLAVLAKAESGEGKIAVTLSFDETY